MDILETDAYDRRKRRNVVQLYSFICKFLFMRMRGTVQNEHFSQLLHENWNNSPLFIFLCRFPSVLRSSFLSHAFLFVLGFIFLPFDSWFGPISHVCRCQMCSDSPAGCSGAELEWRSECLRCGRRTSLFCCRGLLLGLAWAIYTW